MAVNSGWVGTSAKAETKKAWMGEARLELRLPKAGWMSEMIGKSTEVLFINTVNHTQASVHALMGSPTVPNIYILENTATISAATQSGWALQTGNFPAGSTLRVINHGHIRGGGGNGGSGQDGGAGGTALLLNFPTTIDNTSGTIWGGGGGGGAHVAASLTRGGGGGGGIPAGAGGSGTLANGSAGGEVNGGAGGASGTERAGNGGSVGNAGGSSTRSGGRGGYSVQTNGNAVSWIAVGDRRGAVV